jgi:hypothetical protein
MTISESIKLVDTFQQQEPMHTLPCYEDPWCSRTTIKSSCAPYSRILEEIAATAAVSFERAWYAVLEMIELGLIAPAGIGLYDLTQHGKDIASQFASS